MTSRAIIGPAIALGLLLGCSDKVDHPPFLASCVPDRPCATMFGVGSLGTPGGDDGEMGAGGESSEGELHGKVVDIVDDTFQTSAPYIDTAVIEGRRASGTVVSARWNGVDSFVLPEIEAVATSWISVRPESGIAGIRTLHPVATNIVRNVELGIVRADTIDVIFSTLTAAATRDAGAAQIVLGFSTPATSTAPRSGVAGVKIVAPEAAFIAYQTAGTWSTDATATDSTGLVILGNLLTKAFPGSSERVRLGGVTTGYVDVTIASDAVSLVAVGLTP
jgi:hypothetical protein